MPSDAPILESEVLPGLRLRVDFIKLADRYGHRLSVVQRDETGHETLVPLAESVEGASDEPWPPSPPLQSLSIEKLADGRTAALLLGMAGSNHWSASITQTVEGAIEFDCACRYSQTPQALGSAYKAAPLVRAMQDKIFVVLEQPAFGVTMIFHAQAAPPDLESAGTTFRLQAPVQKLARQTTVRWKYFVQLACYGDERVPLRKQPSR